jgi:hypothetical protein
MNVGQRNEYWQEKQKFLEKICLSATLSNSDLTWIDLGSNSDRRGWKPATNVLNFGMAHRNAEESLSKTLMLITDSHF